MKKEAARKQETTYSTPALEKGLDVLELLAHQPTGMTKSQIARALNRTVSEIFRMLVCLEHRGYIAHVQNDQYALTLKLFQLVQEYPPTTRLITEAQPIMHSFTRQTLQSCHLGVIDNSRIIIVAQENSPSPAGFYVKLGSSIDIMDAASGYVILAHQNDSRYEATVAEWKRTTRRRLPADLSTHLDRIRKRGYEERESYQVKGVVNISYPIFDSTGSSIGALTVPYMEPVQPEVSHATVLANLKQATAEITQSIGGILPS